MKYKKVLIQTWYILNGQCIDFPYNELDGQTFENVKVEFETLKNLDVINIEGHEPIECSLLDHHIDEHNVLILDICQDWG